MVERAFRKGPIYGTVLCGFGSMYQEVSCKKHTNFLILFLIILGGGMGVFCWLYKVNSVRGWLVT